MININNLDIDDDVNSNTSYFVMSRNANDQTVKSLICVGDKFKFKEVPTANLGTPAEI